MWWKSNWNTLKGLHKSEEKIGKVKWWIWRRGGCCGTCKWVGNDCFDGDYGANQNDILVKIDAFVVYYSIIKEKKKRKKKELVRGPFLSAGHITAFATCREKVATGKININFNYITIYFHLIYLILL